MKHNALTAFILAFSLCFTTLTTAEEVKLKYQGLTLNANLLLSEEAGYSKIFLITHGTLAHKDMEVIASWQSLLADENISSLAINLSLGLDDRHGMYDCPVTHKHKHEDAVHEISAWANWLKQQGSQAIYLAAHSRGGSQTVLFSNRNLLPEIKAQILLAPQATTEDKHNSSYQKRYQIELAPVLAKAKSMAADAVMSNTGFIYCANTEVTAASFISYYDYNEGFNTPALLRHSQLPTLVIVGSEDNTVAELPKELSKVQNDHVQVLTIEGAGHFFRDLYMDEVVEASTEFLDGL